MYIRLNTNTLLNEEADDSHKDEKLPQQQQITKPSSFKSDNVMYNTSPPLPTEEALIEKSDSIGILSHKNVGDNNPEDKPMLMSSVPQDFEDRQAQAQVRRLDALQDFKDHCEKTSGLLGSDAYVNCRDGQEVDLDGYPTGQTCAAACGNDAIGYGGDCCTGRDACGLPMRSGFTGKGEQRVFHLLTYFDRPLSCSCITFGLIIYTTVPLPHSSFFMCSVQGYVVRWFSWF